MIGVDHVEIGFADMPAWLSATERHLETEHSAGEATKVVGDNFLRVFREISDR